MSSRTYRARKRRELAAEVAYLPLRRTRPAPLPRRLSLLRYLAMPLRLRVPLDLGDDVKLMGRGGRRRSEAVDGDLGKEECTVW
eukprot:CAMPEP_0183360464 /NCGR_PEP_ID=MMETSP0164_2-20130417/55266_1 /TAXON_ID=221442 /ORGANISM="Coccolithus pelagicus ssp braarudi, Strain PLY182g" /LENGTH=83 /DNA_ID=CAMNT_0025534831 /DNA_START=124 /DNA_END=375 /DNA_ORIENTATION=+